MTSSRSRLWDAVTERFWWHYELSIGISISQRPVSHANHIFMPASPLGYSLTLQSSVNYPVTANRTVISQTINQAIKPLWIASSGPGRLETSPFNAREKPAYDSFHVGRILCSYVNSDLHTFRCLQEYLEVTGTHHYINIHDTTGNIWLHSPVLIYSQMAGFRRLGIFTSCQLADTARCNGRTGAQIWPAYTASTWALLLGVDGLHAAVCTRSCIAAIIDLVALKSLCTKEYWSLSKYLCF